MNHLYKSKSGALIFFLFLIFTVPVYGQGHVEIIEKAKTKNFNELVQLVEAYYADKDKGKGSGYKQFKRWEYFHSTRLDENGNVVNVAQRNLEAAGAKKQRASQSRIISDSPGNWKSWGPLVTKHENYNGRINCVAVDPANPAIIYAGSASGGLWRSTDDGASWECLTDQLSSTIGVTSIVIDHSSPVDNRTLYMLTGDRPLGVVSSLGVWKSTDNGNSWRKTRAPIGDQIDDTIDLGYKLIMHPDNNQVLLYSNRKGIFKSSDAGVTWTQKINGVFTDVEFHPADPSIVHAAGYQGTYRSSDTGETWQPVSTGPAGLRIEIAVTPADPAYVYALAGGSYSTAGVFRSTDHGLTYTQIPSSFRFSGKYWYNLAFAASPTDVNTLYGGEVLSYKSVDGGLNWSREQLGHVDHHAMEFYNGYLYVGNDGGVIRKNPITNTVENLSEGLGITQIYKLGHNPHDAGKMLIGSQDNGTGILSNNYSDLIGGSDGMECFYDPLDTNLLYFTTQNGNLYRYNLNGSPSTTNINPPGTRGTGAWVTPFLHDPIDPYAIYAGFTDIWKNPRHGSFDWINLTNGATGTSEATIVTVAPSDNNYIYVVKSSRTLYRTTDGGQTWTITQTEGATPRFTSISIHPENPDILWATGEWFGAYGDGLRVGKSTDGGKTWTNISGSLPNVTTNCSVYQKGTANGIYIGNDLGVYYKDDTMSDWVSFDAGMPYAIVTDLEINHAAGKIYAATYGRGAWSSDLYGASDPVKPVVTITSPEEQQIFTAPASVNFTANASDGDGSIAKVEFYNGSKKLGEDLTSPYAYNWSNVPAGNYTLVASATDNEGNTGADTVSIAVISEGACAATGTILRELWTDIPGRDVASIPVNTSPASTSELAIFESPSNVGDNYGTRVRGYLCVPETGSYTLWISSNDYSELWLSTDTDPGNKTRIAFVTGYTNVRQWDKFSTQRSVAIDLVEGQQYYVEALHKEGVGTDHMAVGWQLPDGTMERPIPGMRLIPFGESGNSNPVLTLTSPEDNQTFTAPASVSIAANASDSDGSITKVEFYNGPEKLGEDLTSPYAYNWSNVSAGNYTLTAKATDDAGASGSASVNIVVNDATSCVAAGTILRELWTDIPGRDVASIPVNTSPASTSELAIFENPSNVGDNYGTRVRGYLCVPETGSYTFWISSNDFSELWLSTDTDPGNKTRIAFVTGYTNVRQWDKFSTQRSVAINLVEGQQYYVEALHKEGVGTDHMAVGWQLPDGTFERPIPGMRLIPFGESGNNNPVVTLTSPEDNQIFTAPASVNIAANASDSDGSITKVEFYNGSQKLGEDLTSPYAYNWNNVPAGNYTLTAKATDDAGASASTSVDIVVNDATSCVAAGTIQRELWTGIAGSDVASIPVHTSPSSISELTIFEDPSNVGDSYGTRVSGYLCVTETGNYTFWISSNDHSELWLSTGADPGNKTKIAFVTGYTNVRQWDKYSTQRSVGIDLVAGQQYYIEALHKEGVGTDHMAVGWQLPDGTLERPIAGSRLSPHSTPSAAPPRRETWYFSHEESTGVTLFPNPYSDGTLTMTIAAHPEGPYHEASMVDIELLSVTGELIFKASVDCGSGCETFVIPLEEKLPSGMYFLNATLNRRKYWKKLSVQ